MCGTFAGPSASSCDGVCLGLAIGITLGAVVFAIIAFVVGAHRRGRLPSPRCRWTTGETSTGTTDTSAHKTVIHVGSDKDNEEDNRYCHIDDTADTPNDEYLHVERSDVFNSTA